MSTQPVDEGSLKRELWVLGGNVWPVRARLRQNQCSGHLSECFTPKQYSLSSPRPSAQMTQQSINAGEQKSFRLLLVNNRKPCLGLCYILKHGAQSAKEGEDNSNDPCAVLGRIHGASMHAGVSTYPICRTALLYAEKY